MNSLGIVFFLTLLCFPVQGETKPSVDEKPPPGTEPRKEAADDPEGDEETDASKSMVHHRKAEAYFRAKRYKEAAEEFLKAYSLDERPAFLYLAGDAYERAGSFKNAETMYEKYLKTATNEFRIKAVMESLENLRTRVDLNGAEKPEKDESDEIDGEKDEETPEPEKKPKDPEEKKTLIEHEKTTGEKTEDPDETPLPARPRSRMELGAWALLGSTAVLLTVTGVFALKMRDSEDNMKRLAVSVDPNNNLRVPYEGNYRKDYERYKRDGELFQNLTWVFAGLSAAAVTGSVVLFTIDYVTRRRKSLSVRNGIVRPVISRDGGGVQMELRF